MCWIDGRTQSQDAATVPVMDRGFLYGDALFETVAVAAGRARHLEAHVDRLRRAARTLGIDHPDIDRLDEVTRQLIAANRLDDGVLRIVLTRGSSRRGLATCGAGPARMLVLAFAAAAAGAPAAANAAPDAWRVVLSTVRRVGAGALPVDAKTANYLPNVLAYRQAEAAGADEALMLTPDGDGYASGSFGNLFAAIGGVLVGPGAAQGALPGITRGLILDAAARLGIVVTERAASAAELHGATEIFLSNSVMRLRSATHLEDRPLPADRPLADRLRAALADMPA